jgi:small subunit ribosomal protein S9
MTSGAKSEKGEGSQDMVQATSKAIYATGRRKASVARVWFFEGEEKKIEVNGLDLDAYFTREDLRMIIKQPLEAVRCLRYRIRATVKGGGVAGQAGALRHGISRALGLQDETSRSALRTGGFLTRDPREKERKKYGRKGARRSFQYTKR